MDKEQILQRIGYGAAAGLIGTAAVQVARTANQKASEQTAAPGREGPSSGSQAAAEQGAGAFLKTAVSVLSTGFGSTGAALAAFRDEPKVLVEGALLGTGVWAVSQFTGRESTRSQSAGRIVWSVAQYMLFGIATVSAYRRLKRAIG